MGNKPFSGISFFNSLLNFEILYVFLSDLHASMVSLNMLLPYNINQLLLAVWPVVILIISKIYSDISLRCNFF